MRRIFFILVLSFSSKLCAMYNGNPSAPMMPDQGPLFTHSWATLKTGYVFDNVFERKLENETHHLRSNDENMVSRAQFGSLTLVLADRVELFSGLGSMRSSIFQHSRGNRIRYHTGTHFAWSIGGRTIFSYWDNLQFGLNASYLHFFPDFQSITLNGNSVPKGDAELQYHEWQVGAGISYHFWWLFPYIAAKYSQSQAQFLHIKALESLLLKKNFTLENDKHYGLVIGCGIAPEIGFALNAEGRFIDETAFTISADFRF